MTHARTLLVATGAVAATVAAVLTATPASGAPVKAPKTPKTPVTATPVTVADWQMNEAKRATVMVDSGPNKINGVIGTGVKTGTVIQGATSYQFPWTKPNTPPAMPQNLVTVDDSRLNPGTGDYAVVVRYRTTNSFGNLIQKGQNKTAGGYFKVEMPGGHVTCLYKDGVVGPNGKVGQRAITTLGTYKDGQWHTLRCERTATGVTLTIYAADGVTVQEKRSIKGPTGSIANDWPLSIGGKPRCDQIKVTCDYFPGAVDWVRIESSTPPPVAKK